MFSKLLLNHGNFCASHPWEVIVSVLTITICSISMALYKFMDEICDYNVNSPEIDEKSSDVIILTFTKCVAIFYVYLQFKKLRKIGSKYILGLAGLFTIFSSFIISATAIKLIGLDLYYIKESVPFFLLLIDLSKASTLGKFALNFVNFNTNYNVNTKPLSKQEEVTLIKESIGKSLTILGPSFTLDTLVEIMVVGIGTLSGIKTLEIACLFGCMAILVNYFIFMSFYPSCLSLIMQVSHSASATPTNTIATLTSKQLLKDDCNSSTTAAPESTEAENTLSQPNTNLGHTKITDGEGLYDNDDQQYLILPRQILVDDSNFWKFSAIFNDLTETTIPTTTSTPFLLNTKLVDDITNTNDIEGGKLNPLKDYMHSASSILGNPVIQRIKIIMSLGLLIVHLHSRFFLSNNNNNHTVLITVPGHPSGLSNNHSTDLLPTNESLGGNNAAFLEGPPIATQQLQQEYLKTEAAGIAFPFIVFLIKRIIYLKIQDWITIIFAILTGIHYFYFSVEDRKDRSQPLCPNEKTKNPRLTINNSSNSRPKTTSSITVNGSLNNKVVHKRLSFMIGDYASEYKTLKDQSTQTSNQINMRVSTSLVTPLKNDGLFFDSSPSSSVQLDDEMALTEKLVLKQVSSHSLDTLTGNDYEKSIRIRRSALIHELFSPKKGTSASFTPYSGDLIKEESFIEGLPYQTYPDYALVNGACCENVIGYVPLPLGIAGPLLLDGKTYHLPMATTEGCLVASTNRGCRAIMESFKAFKENPFYHASQLSIDNEMIVNGVYSAVYDSGMTRGPIVMFPNCLRASTVKVWCDNLPNFHLLKKEFESTSRYLNLHSIHSTIAGRRLLLRFKATTGDAMGMNMISKACDHVLKFMKTIHSDMEILSLSGNYCTDKKAAAINWIEGRGKSVVCEALIHSETVKKVLKTNVPALVELNENKNLIGSAMAGTVGGFNAHAANIVTAIYIATGQDPAQVVSSSNCITLMEYGGSDNEDLLISCTMPCLELGTVGGGTILTAQKSCLKILGVDGPNENNPGENSTQLARIICGAVLAGELSLMSALSAGHLVKSHLKYNRSQNS